MGIAVRLERRLAAPLATRIAVPVVAVACGLLAGGIVMALGGWKTERMMRRYAAVTDETLRRAAEAVAGQSAIATSSSTAGREERAAV